MFGFLLELNDRMDIKISISKNIQTTVTGQDLKKKKCMNGDSKLVHIALLTFKENERLHLFIQERALHPFVQMEHRNVCLTVIKERVSSIFFADRYLSPFCICKLTTV